MLYLILACTGAEDSDSDSGEPPPADSAPSCVVEDAEEIQLPAQLLVPWCQDPYQVNFTMEGGEGYISIAGLDCGGADAGGEVIAYPSLEVVATYPMNGIGLYGANLIVQPPGQGWQLWGVFGSSQTGKQLLGWDIETWSPISVIDDPYSTNIYPSAAGSLIGWSTWYQDDGEPTFSVYDLQDLPETAGRGDAIAVHSGTTNSRLYYSIFIPDTNGDGLDDLLSLAWTGPTSSGILLVDHADAITDQGYLNGSPIPGNFGRAIAAPDWDGDGLPDIATYNNEEQESDFFVYRGTDADLLAHYYRDPVPPPTAWETPFGFGAQTVDGLVEEGQQAILIEDRDTPNGDRIRVLLPGSCGSEPVAETPYLLRDPLTIEYTPFLAGGDLMVQMLTNNEILLSSNQF